MENKNKEYYLFINGEKVIVTEEVYRAYIRPVRAEQRARRREKKCCVLGEKGNLVRCTRDCETCEYAEAGKKTSGSFLSLDGLMDAGFDVADPNTDIERELAEREEKQEIKVKVQAAIAQLTPRQQEMVRLRFYEGKSQEEIAKIFNIDGSSASAIFSFCALRLPFCSLFLFNLLIVFTRLRFFLFGLALTLDFLFYVL